MTLHFHLQYALPITQHCKQRTAREASQQSIISRVYNGEDTLDHIANGKYSHREAVSRYVTEFDKTRFRRTKLL